MSADLLPQLIVFGDFNCPFSALASARAGVLERRGLATIDWRAVEHAPDIPSQGRPVVGDQRLDLERELDQVRGLLLDGEADALRLPVILSNTRRATLAYAATPAIDRPRVRQQLFAAYWMHEADLGDPATLSGLGALGQDEGVATQWRDEWSALARPIVPLMVLPDGYVSRGLGALARLAEMIANGGAVETGHRTEPADLGGESPCFAHLLEDGTRPGPFTDGAA